MDRNGVVSQSGRRVHVVMVPGFGGFDALGQLQYYAGLTPAFSRWRSADGRRRNMVLHYFDTFPTAAVVTRAARLKSYLAKRVARGEFQPGDRVCLVGHSTGGLDVRRLLGDLAASPGEVMSVDGGQGTACAVMSGEVLEFVHRVVFLSVPHWGTNIADWIRAHAIARMAAVADLRLSVAASQLPFAAVLRDWLAKGASYVADADLLRAIEDALAEIDPAVGEAGPTRTAAAHEAAAELELWLRHMVWDFSALDDLAPERPMGAEAPPPAVLPAGKDEPRGWAKAAGHSIVTRSYATLGRSPFPLTGPEIPTWELLRPETYPDCVPTTDADVVYRACYRACAGGPFQRTVPDGAPRFLSPSHQKTIASWRHHAGLERWENDGIVNTASMFWPDERATFLVPADHMDIVGHYKPVRAFPGTGRTYHAYDLLGSCSGFNDTLFAQVWNDVFTFCRQAR